MTRKRFVKLLMAQGYSRNEAVWEAEKVQKLHVSYSQAIQFVRYNMSFSECIDVICDGLKEFQKAMLNGLHAIANRIRNIEKEFGDDLI